jgi:amino acid adenylation domain-containing protein
MTMLLHDLLSQQAATRPDATALAMGSTRVRYGELEVASNRLAHLLQEAGCAPGDRVALVMPKSVNAIVAFFGVLKAGGMYVPIDATQPVSRIRSMLESCEPRVILAAGSGARAIDALDDLDALPNDARIGWFDCETHAPLRSHFTLVDVTAFSPSRPDVAQSEAAAAHIVFTSGSTGVPKGVVITHANVLSFVEWANGFFMPQPGDRHSGHSPLHFDLSTYDVFGTIAAGAELHLVPPERNLLPHRIADFIRESALTQWFSVPSLLTFMLKAGVVRAHDFQSLRRVLWCGEPFPVPSLRDWMQRVPHATFTNLYGPTETTIASSYHRVEEPPEPRDPLPIGLPCDGESLLVLDEQLHPLPPGEIGDLYIGGVGLSAGYWRDPEKTRAAFIRTPFPPPNDRLYRTGDLAHVDDNGLFHFHGRADTQIKSRGYRIELGEIESALLALDDVSTCAVVALETDSFEGTEVCCAITPVPGRRPTMAALREGLAARVPRYMLPARWRLVDTMPRNGNGKIDRRAITAMFQQEAAVA